MLLWYLLLQGDPLLLLLLMHLLMQLLLQLLLRLRLQRLFRLPGPCNCCSRCCCCCCCCWRHVQLLLPCCFPCEGLRLLLLLLGLWL